MAVKCCRNWKQSSEKTLSSRVWVAPKFMNYNKLYTILGLTGVALAATARADLIVTYAEQAGAVNSTLQNTEVDNFTYGTSGITAPAGSASSSYLASGQYSNLSWVGGSGSLAGQTIGTIDKVFLQNANQYGGATDPSVYPVPSESVGGSQAVPVTTLTLSATSSYFGFWWSAGDPENVLSFYKGGVLEAQYTTADLLGQLPTAYFGNPTTGFKGQDASEGFAFLNFYGTDGASWDEIKLSNLGSSGFESDNWTSRVEPWGADPGETGPVPGVEVSDVVVAAPEPANVIAGLGVAVVFATGAFRRSRRAAAGQA